MVWAALAALALTGCLDRRYEPLPDSPDVEDSALVGRWVDGDGGVLVLREDLTAEATDVECARDRSPASGRGTWRAERDAGPAGEMPLGGDLVVVVDAGCAHRFGVAGTGADLRLYYYRGDFDARDAYLLDRG